MIPVNFYIATQNNPSALCRLTEKAYQNGFQVWCRLQNEAQVSHLDHLLWTFRDISFVPHGVVKANATDTHHPVMLGTTEQLDGMESSATESTAHPTLLLNLATTLSPHLATYHKICEWIMGDEPTKQAGRERYRTYQQNQQFEITTIQV